MNEIESAEVTALLAELDKLGCVLDYVMLRAEHDLTAHELHRAAAIKGIEVIDRRLQVWAESMATPALPAERFFRVTWEEGKLRGVRVSFTEFWGNDDVHPRQVDDHIWLGQAVDGYKTAFFLPPHELRGRYHEQKPLFDRINAIVLGPDPAACEFYSWTTDWSNYFDDGHEGWGAFYWTIRRPDSDFLTVVGASATD